MKVDMMGTRGAAFIKKSAYGESIHPMVALPNGNISNEQKLCQLKLSLIV
jgi:hypothetical protein